MKGSDTSGRLLLSAALLLGAESAAAIVNIEALRQETLPEGFSGSVELVLGGKSGNVDKEAYEGAARIDWARGDQSAFVLAEREYGRTEGVRDANRTFLHLRGMRAVSPRYTGEAYVQLEQDEFRRLKLRRLAGGGVRIGLVGGQTVSSLHLGVGAYGYEEHLDELVDDRDSGTRASLYLDYRYRLSERVSAASTTYYQPRVGEAADFRALEQASLLFGVSERLDMRLSLDFVHDSRPPAGVERSDLLYRTSLLYRF